MEKLPSTSFRLPYSPGIDKKAIICFLFFNLVWVILLVLVPPFYLAGAIGILILILILMAYPKTGLYLLPIVLVNPVAIAPGTQYNVHESLIFLLLFFFLARVSLTTQGSKTYPPKSYRWFLFLFLTSASLSLLNATYLEPGLIHLVKLALAFGFVFFYVYNQTENRKTLKNVLAMIILSNVIAAFYGIYQYHFGEVGFTLGKRIFGLVGGNFGAFIGLAIVALFSGILFQPDRLKRILFLILLVPLAWALFLSQTRAWILGTIVSIFTISGFALYKKHGLRKLIVALVLIIFLGICVSGFAKSVLYDVYSSLFIRKASPSAKVTTQNLERLPDLSLLVRKRIWNFGLHLFSKYPLTGIGIGNMRLGNAFLPTLTYPRPQAGFADSNYINILAETGILGAMAWIFLIATIFRYSKRLVRLSVTPDWLYISSSIIGGLVVLFVGGVFWVLTCGLVDSAILATMIALLFAASRVLTVDSKAPEAV